MDYTLQHLRYFVSVAEHGSVSAAARNLYVSQPGLSAAILHLEEALGIQLFIRHHAKGVSLTPAGRLFVDEARDVLTRASNLKKRAKYLSQTADGPLNVGCSTTSGILLMPKILQELKEHYPEIEVRLRVEESTTLQQCLRTGEVELALLYDVDLDASLQKVFLMGMRPYVILPQNHRLAGAKSIDLGDLVGEPLLLIRTFEASGSLIPLFSKLQLTPRVVENLGSLELVRGLVASGKGYSILYTKPAFDHTYDGSSLVSLPIKGDLEPLSIVLLSAQGGKSSARSDTFSDICRNVVSGLRNEDHWSMCRLPSLKRNLEN